MRGILLLLVFLFMGSSFLHAQIPGYLGTKYVSFGKIKKDKKEPGRIRFSGVKFVDNRPDKACIANLFVGNNIIRYNFEQGFSQVDHFVNTVYQNDFRKDGDSLLVLINDFGITTSIGTPDAYGSYMQVKKYHLIRIKGILAELHAGRVALIGIYDTLLVFKPPQSGKYEASLKKALKTIVLNANYFPEKEGFPKENLTRSEFDSRYLRKGKPDYAILRDVFVNKGVYRDFHQFLNNAPEQGIGDSGQGNSGSTVGEASRFDEMPEYEMRDSSTIWGYSDGDIIYVNTKSPAGFCPITRDGFLYSVSATGRDVRQGKRHPTVMTIVGIVAVVAVLGVFIILSKGSSSHGSHSGGGGSAIGGRSGPRPGSPGGAVRTGSGGGHPGSHSSVPDFGSFSGGSNASISGEVFVLPQIVLSEGDSFYRVKATRVDMETGMLEF